MITKNKAKRYDVISPDGFSIHFSDTYRSKKKAIESLMEWTKRYEKQGYYSSVKYGKIYLGELHNYCRIIEL